MEPRSPSPPRTSWLTPVVSLVVGVWMLPRDALLAGLVLAYGLQSASARIAMVRPEPVWRTLNLVVGVATALALVAGGVYTLRTQVVLGVLLLIAGVWTVLLRAVPWAMAR